MDSLGKIPQLYNHSVLRFSMPYDFYFPVGFLTHTFKVSFYCNGNALNYRTTEKSFIKEKYPK